LKRFEGILFCTDIDGTLFSSDKTVSNKNLEAIEYFKSKGGIFTFITGRAPQISMEICNIVNPNAPFGCVNGGGIYDYRKNKLLWSVTLPKEVIELVDCVYSQLPEIGIQIITEKEIYFIKDNPTMVNYRANRRLSNVTCRYDTLKEPILKIMFVHEEDKELSKVINILNAHPKAPQFDFIRSEHSLYEILPKGVSKGAVLGKMAELLGIDINRTIAVGDYNNDVSMLQKANIGFAVANAVDEAKSIADYITVSNDDSAIAAIVEGLDQGIFRFVNRY